METSESVRKRILAVEDEPSISDVCKRVLARKGFEVDVAVNGKDTRDMVTQNQYKIFLIDIRTSAMNGIELYEWSKEKHPQLTEGVIFTTGSVLDDKITGYLKASGRPFLPNPFRLMT
jgi:DNA-binding response OmpR family regulator